MKYKFEFTEEEVNLVLKGIGKLPAEEVFLLMNKVISTAQAQSKTTEVESAVEV